MCFVVFRFFVDFLGTFAVVAMHSDIARLVGSTDSKLKSKGHTMAEQQFTPGERLVLKVKQRKSIMNRSVLIGSGFLVLNQDGLAEPNLMQRGVSFRLCASLCLHHLTQGGACTWPSWKSQ